MSVDYIIIGSGSAGAVMANRLSADPQCRVLLLEAGGTDKKMEIRIPGAYGNLHRSEVDWKFWTEPQEHVDNRRIYLPRGKVLGGSSSTNAMAYVRGSRHDFDEWASLGNSGWGYDDVLPYFRKSEHNEELNGHYHGKGGPLHVSYSRQPSPLAEKFIRACTECGLRENGDYNGEEQLGAHLLQFTIRNGIRQSTAKAFLDPVKSRPNLQIRTHCHVSRILIDGGAAVGVEFIHKGSKEQVLCSKEVILSAGTFQSPQILMLSGIGDREELAGFGIACLHHLPGVGRNLQDHVWSGASGLVDIPTGNSVLRPLNMARAIAQHLLFRKGPLCNSVLEANAFWRSPAADLRPDLQFHFVPIGIATDDYSVDIYDIKTYSRENGYGILSILIRPHSRGYVTLRSSDPLDAPRVDPKLLSDPRDLQTLLTGLRKCIGIGEAPSLREHSPKGVVFPSRPHSDEKLVDHIRKSLETLYHPVGTCKMGNDGMAVVDHQLRVHGLRNLRVVDASIMPTIVSGNTNAATIMIAEKASDAVRSSATLLH